VAMATTLCRDELHRDMTMYCVVITMYCREDWILGLC
jgi:hypothetical protein